LSSSISSFCATAATETRASAHSRKYCFFIDLILSRQR
jgi:hypothetical protein